MKTVLLTEQPTDVVTPEHMNPSKLYGVRHRAFDSENNFKVYKVHHCRGDANRYAMIGFRTSTGHLAENQDFSSLQGVADYCREHGHSLYEFDNAVEFGQWLVDPS